MKTVVLSLLMALVSSQALAHPSVVPHGHPRDVSVLPDLGALLVAALLVAAVVAARQLLRKG